MRQRDPQSPTVHALLQEFFLATKKHKKLKIRSGIFEFFVLLVAKISKQQYLAKLVAGTKRKTKFDADRYQ